jgi:flagellar motor switch/type III secretory pathway protein FliN
MNVALFDVHACPRVSSASARALRAALPAMAWLPRRWEVQGPSGRTVGTLEGFALDGVDSDGVALPVTLGTATSRLVVDTDFATRLVDAALVGRGAFLSARRFGPAERGVLAGLLGTVFQTLGWRVGLGRMPLPRDEAAQACFRVETPMAGGLVWLAVETAAPNGRSATEAFARSSRALAVIASARIAATHLTAREIAGLAVGDAVVFTGSPASAFPAEGAWKGALALGEAAGGHLAAIAIDETGTLRLAGAFEPIADTGRTLRKETGMETSDVTEATVALAAAPIEVVAEVGRVRLRGEEVMGLVPGAVLTLPEGRTRVSLRIAGELLAEGELVNVDGELGVRVTRMAAR